MDWGMDSVNIIIGNLCSLLAMGTDVLSAAQKTAKRVLWVQNLSQLIYFICAVVLKGYSGAAQNVVSIIRNLVVIRNRSSKAVEWFLVVLGVALGLCFNNLGWVGLLPVIANLQFTLGVFRFKDNERALKISFLLNAVMYGIFNLAIYNVVGFGTNLVVTASTAIYLLKRKTSD